MDWLQIGLFIFNLLIGVIVALIGFFINSILKRVETLEMEMKAVKTNYLDRFTAVLKNQLEMKEELIEEQSKVRFELATQQLKMKEELLAQNATTEKLLLTAINKIKIDLIKHQSGTNE
jgi:hypothetical protein